MQTSAISNSVQYYILIIYHHTTQNREVHPKKDQSTQKTYPILLPVQQRDCIEVVAGTVVFEALVLKNSESSQLQFRHTTMPKSLTWYRLSKSSKYMHNIFDIISDTTCCVVLCGNICASLAKAQIRKKERTCKVLFASPFRLF